MIKENCMYRNLYEKNIIIIIKSNKNLKTISKQLKYIFLRKKLIYLFFIRSTHTFIFIKFK